MNTRYQLISQIVLWVLMIIGIIVSVMFYVGGSEGSLEVAGDFLDIPKYSDMMLGWNYFLLGLVCCVTIVFVLVKFFKMFASEPKRAIANLVIVLCFAGLCILCWALGSPAEVKIIGYEGTDNVGTMAQLSDACLYMTYILIVATVIVLACGRIYTRMLK
ncbi:MAG: hypothetical protein IJS00_07185 [Paludibacteraceae bacterium]|nr:hypothetical protein [Paludibacteraceae bacterium]